MVAGTYWRAQEFFLRGGAKLIFFLRNKTLGTIEQKQTAKLFFTNRKVALSYVTSIYPLWKKGLPWLWDWNYPWLWDWNYPLIVRLEVPPEGETEITFWSWDWNYPLNTTGITPLLTLPSTAPPPFPSTSSSSWSICLWSTWLMFITPTRIIIIFGFMAPEGLPYPS